MSDNFIAESAAIPQRYSFVMYNIERCRNADDFLFVKPAASFSGLRTRSLI